MNVIKSTIVFLALFAFSYSDVYSQDLFTESGITADFKRRDVFINYSQTIQYGRHAVGMGVGFGTRAAFVQNRSFTQVKLEYGYELVESGNFRLYEHNSFAYSTMRLGLRKNKQSLHVLELMPGILFSYGTDLKIKCGVLGGLYSELIAPKPTYKMHKVSLGYQFTFGIVHEF